MATNKQRLQPLINSGLFAIFVVGFCTTVLLALATQDIGELGGPWLQQLLSINKVILYVLALGVIYQLWRLISFWGKLVQNLMIMLVLQLAVALIIAIIPLVLIFTAAEDYYGTQLDDAITASDAIRNSIIEQQARYLDSVAVVVGDQLDEDASSLGVFLDNLRLQENLDSIVIVDNAGRALLASPPGFDSPQLSPIMLQLAQEGSGSRQLTETEDGRLLLVWFKPLERIGVLDGTIGGIRIEQLLSENLSDDIKAVEGGVRSYHNSLSVRDGVRNGVQLVIVNSIALLVFLAVALAAFAGIRLSQRLSRLSSKMLEVAALEEPSGEVPESGNDEITKTSQAFNQMIQKVGASVSNEKQQRLMLEAVQETMNAGLLVVDNKNIRNINPEAREILRGEMELDVFNEQIKEKPTLEQLAKIVPETAGFVEWVLKEDRLASSEINVGSHRLQVRTATFEVTGQSPRTVILFTDISEPLEHGASRVREEAFSFTLHGINNPLQAALIQTELLELYANKIKDDEIRDQLQNTSSKVMFQLQRINEQAKAWGKLSGMEKVRFTAVDINAIIRSTIKNTVAGDINIDFDLDSSNPLVYFDKNMLLDTVENLFNNSVDQFNIVDITSKHIKISTEVIADTNSVVFEFIDNAGGIADQLLPDIFKLKKSTKETGHGLGLARAYEWLSKAQATFEAKNLEAKHGFGATFQITFKMATEKGEIAELG